MLVGTLSPNLLLLRLPRLPVCPEVEFSLHRLLPPPARLVFLHLLCRPLAVASSRPAVAAAVGSSRFLPPVERLVPQALHRVVASLGPQPAPSVPPAASSDRELELDLRALLLGLLQAPRVGRACLLKPFSSRDQVLVPRGAGGADRKHMGKTAVRLQHNVPTVALCTAAASACMYSDDEDAFGVGGRSPSPGDGRNERRRDDDRGPKGGSKGGDRSGRQDRRRTTGREIPKLYSIHKGTVARVQDYGAFVRLGDGSRYKKRQQSYIEDGLRWLRSCPSRHPHIVASKQTAVHASHGQIRSMHASRSGAARGDGGHDRGSFQLGPVEGGLSALKAFTNRLANLKNKRGKLVNELELAQKKLALSHASTEEMRRTLEEEVENERQAKLLISRQFIQATSSYEKLSDLLEFEQMKSSEQYKDLQARLQKAIIEHGKSQCAADEFQKKIVKLDKQCQQLQQENDQLKLQLLKADNVNDALKKQIAKQDALIEELMTLQHASQEESLQLRKENRTLKKRLEVAERKGQRCCLHDGLLHISRLSASGRVEAVADVLAQDDAVWVKVVEVREEEGKFSLDMRFVGQRDGEDQDPNNVQADAGKGKGQGKSAPEPIRIGAIQATTCSRCGARGHSARECWAGGGKQYDLVEEAPESSGKAGGRGLEDAAGGHDAATVKKALQEYFKRKAAGEDSSSSSSSSDKKKKKKKKKEKKKDKKEKKKKKKDKKKDKSAAKEA
eukprot:s887_g6.t3